MYSIIGRIVICGWWLGNTPVEHTQNGLELDDYYREGQKKIDLYYQFGNSEQCMPKYQNTIYCVGLRYT